MTSHLRHNGSALLMTVFIVALLSATVIGLLQLNTSEIQLMSNHVFAAQALAIAQAGLNDAFFEIRADNSWTDGFTNKPFGGGSYTVVVTDVVTEVVTSTDPIPPDVTDNELDAEALGPLSPGATQQFAIYHPNLTGADFDSRAKITITAGSYSYTGGMNGSPFALAIPLDATTVNLQIVMKIQDYPQIPANVNCQVSWTLGSSGSTSTTSTSASTTIISEGTSAQGYVARVTANVIVGTSAPYDITIQTLRVNE